jgi:hypothetical protein
MSEEPDLRPRPTDERYVTSEPSPQPQKAPVDEPTLPPPGTAPPRVEALRDAARLINGSRNEQYGNPIDNFGRISKIWSVILGVEVTAEDVAMCMAGLKMARYASKSGFQPDTWIDIAGYAGCGYEVGKTESERS